MNREFVLDFLDQARFCPDVATLKSSLQKSMDSVGFSRWAYVLKGKIDHSYPEQWVEHYIRQNYGSIDPIITKGSLCHAPFQWSKIAALDSLSRREREYYIEAIDFGLVDGLGVPIFGGAGSAMFSMASDEKPSEIGQQLSTNQHQLIALGFAFHAVYSQLTSGLRLEKSPLSPREVECLLWTARGKTSWEIGKIMNITERTVIFHIENCKRKLKVKNRSQATVKAIAAGYIQP